MRALVGRLELSVSSGLAAGSMVNGGGGLGSGVIGENMIIALTRDAASATEDSPGDWRGGGGCNIGTTSGGGGEIPAGGDAAAVEGLGTKGPPL